MRQWRHRMKLKGIHILTPEEKRLRDLWAEREESARLRALAAQRAAGKDLRG